MERTVDNSVLYFFYFFFGSFYCLLVKCCKSVCAVCKSLAPVNVDRCSVNDGLHCVCIIYAPVNGSRCKSSIRSYGSHVDLVAYTWNACCLTCCRSACCICVLTDQNTSVRDQSICTFLFQVKACPAVCIFYFHCNGRAYAPCAKVEGCISQNNLCVWESAYITHFCLILCDLAGLDKSH